MLTKVEEPDENGKKEVPVIVNITSSRAEFARTVSAGDGGDQASNASKNVSFCQLKISLLVSCPLSCAGGSDPPG